MEVLSLLRSKNRCLEKFLAVTQEFCEDSRWNSDDSRSSQADAAIQVERQREAILKAFQLYDRKINEAMVHMPASNWSDSLATQAKGLEERRLQLIEQIIIEDERLMSRIEAIQHSLLAEINESKSNRSRIGKFKSAWVPNAGSELDEKA